MVHRSRVTDLHQISDPRSYPPHITVSASPPPEVQLPPVPQEHEPPSRRRRQDAHPPRADAPSTVSLHPRVGGGLWGNEVLLGLSRDDDEAAAAHGTG